MIFSPSLSLSLVTVRGLSCILCLHSFYLLTTGFFHIWLCILRLPNSWSLTYPQCLLWVKGRVRRFLASCRGSCSLRVFCPSVKTIGAVSDAVHRAYPKDPWWLRLPSSLLPLRHWKVWVFVCLHGLFFQGVRTCSLLCIPHIYRSKKKLEFTSAG